jgi:hypothetical protein
MSGIYSVTHSINGEKPMPNRRDSEIKGQIGSESYLREQLERSFRETKALQQRVEVLEKVYMIY